MGEGDLGLWHRGLGFRVARAGGRRGLGYGRFGAARGRPGVWAEGVAAVEI